MDLKFLRPRYTLQGFKAIQWDLEKTQGNRAYWLKRTLCSKMFLISNQTCILTKNSFVNHREILVINKLNKPYPNFSFRPKTKELRMKTCKQTFLCASIITASQGTVGNISTVHGNAILSSYQFHTRFHFHTESTKGFEKRNQPERAPNI